MARSLLNIEMIDLNRMYTAMTTKRRYKSRRAGGFTLLELLIALVILGILAAVAMPSFSRSINMNKLNRAAAVLSTDFRLALSLAARQRQPVQIAFNSSTKTYTFSDRASGSVLHERTLGTESEYKLTALSCSVASIDVLPTGTTSGPLTVKLASQSGTRTVTMSSAGQIRVSSP